MFSEWLMQREQRLDEKFGDWFSPNSWSDTFRGVPQGSTRQDKIFDKEERRREEVDKKLSKRLWGDVKEMLSTFGINNVHKVTIKGQRGSTEISILELAKKSPNWQIFIQACENIIKCTMYREYYPKLLITGNDILTVWKFFKSIKFFDKNDQPTNLIKAMDIEPRAIVEKAPRNPAHKYQVDDETVIPVITKLEAEAEQPEGGSLAIGNVKYQVAQTKKIIEEYIAKIEDGFWDHYFVDPKNGGIDKAFERLNRDQQFRNDLESHSTLNQQEITDLIRQYNFYENFITSHNLKRSIFTRRTSAPGATPSPATPAVPATPGAAANPSSSHNNPSVKPMNPKPYGP